MLKMAWIRCTLYDCCKDGGASERELVLLEGRRRKLKMRMQEPRGCRAINQENLEV